MKKNVFFSRKPWSLRSISLLLLVSVCTLPSMASGADTLTLSLSSGISMALLQSPSARSARHSFLASHWNHRYFKANYLPSVSLSSTPNINNVINKITQSDGTVRFIQQSHFSGDLSLSVNQNIALTGGTLFLSSGLSYLREFEDKSNMFSSVPVSLGYSQSLFGYNSLKWDKRIEPLRYTYAKKNYAEAIELVSAQTCSYFFSLASAMNEVQMARSNFASADTLYRMAQGRYKIGTITENEMIQLEIRRLSEETSVMDAEISLEERLQVFRSFLGLPQDTPIRLLLPDSVPQFEVPFSQALELAMLNSPDPTYYKLQNRQAESSLARAKANAGLRADIYLKLGLSQTGKDAAQAYKHPASQEYGSVSLSLPILDWGRGRGMVRVAKSDLELTQIRSEQGMDDFRQNVQKLVSQFNMQGKKVRIARLTEKRAEHRYNVAMRLYIMGQTSLLELNDAIAERNASRRSHISSMSTFWNLYYTLRSITGYDFQTRHPLTEQLPI
ncbi:MAG: TolC family protein [Bacteroidaceae bacterium]|nr:TolC family protein [Bacteroidaceae bacterium]